MVCLSIERGNNAAKAESEPVMSKSRTLTAVSLNPLPNSEELRSALVMFLDRHPSPGDVLRGFADMLDDGEIPVGTSPICESDSFLADYRSRINRRSFRVTEETRRKLDAIAFATSLRQTSIIRLALNQAEQAQGQDQDQG